MQDSVPLHTLVINSLEEQIAVIDQDGTIVDVNSAWTRFGIENGLSSAYATVGCNYLKVVSTSVARGDCLAAEAAQGISDVLRGTRTSSYFEYPCHSPDEERWFLMRVTRLNDNSRNMFVISHQNITQRKLAEQRRRRSRRRSEPATPWRATPLGTGASTPDGFTRTRSDSSSSCRW